MSVNAPALADVRQLGDAVRTLYAAGFSVRVGKAGRVLLQPPLFSAASGTEDAVSVVLASPAAEVRRMIPKRPRPRRRPRPNGGRR